MHCGVIGDACLRWELKEKSINPYPCCLRLLSAVSRYKNKKRQLTLTERSTVPPIQLDIYKTPSKQNVTAQIIWKVNFMVACMRE